MLAPVRDGSPGLALWEPDDALAIFWAGAGARFFGFSGVLAYGFALAFGVAHLVVVEALRGAQRR